MKLNIAAQFKRNGLLNLDVAGEWVFMQRNLIKSFIRYGFIFKMTFTMEGLHEIRVHLRTDLVLGLHFSGANDDFYGD